MADKSLNQYPFLSADNEMGMIIQSVKWPKPGLGSPDQWPMALKQTLSIILHTDFPMLICWGKDHAQFYNDAFMPLVNQGDHLQIIGTNVKDNTFKNNWQKISVAVNEGLNGKSTQLSNFCLILNRKGYAEDCFFDFSFSPIKDENGNVGGVLLICRETSANVKAIITQEDFEALNEELAEAIEEYATTNEELSASNEELLLTQRELQRSEKLFRSIALNIPRSLIIVIDKDHRLVTVEGDLMVKLGYAGINYAGKHPSDILSIAHYEATKQFYDRVLAGETFSEELTLPIGGNYIVHFVPLRAENNEVTSALIIALDITEIKHAEEKSAKLAAIVESSDDAIISKTLDSIITSWNDSAERMFGYTADETIGESIYKLIPSDRWDEEPLILSQLTTGKRVEHFETKRLTKQGKLIDVSLSISPVKDSKGHIIGVSKIARDITEKKLEEQRKNDFVAMVSHELKTPLTTISTYIQVLLAQAKKEKHEFRINALSRTALQTKKMETMIHDFLSLARLDDGKITLNQSVFELHPLLSEAVMDVKILNSKHEIELIACEEILLYADRDKVGQVLNNLLSNAIKYSPDGGKITIGCVKTAGNVKVFVKDQGVGINKADQQRLFQRFFRSTNEKLKMVSGFGIGLYLVSEVLRFHDSKIELESEENVGSTFAFTLPIYSKT